MQDRQLETSGLLHTMPKPTVALVNGYAMGAGFSFALACDLRLCSEKAKFGMAFRNVGLPGDFGGAYFLPRVVGQGLAREIYFSGEVIDAQRAHAIGLANRVYPADDFLAEALAYAGRLAQGPTKALGRMKANLNRSGEGAGMEEILMLEADQHAHVAPGPRSHRRPGSLHPRRQARLQRALTRRRAQRPATHLEDPCPTPPSWSIRVTTASR